MIEIEIKLPLAKEKKTEGAAGAEMRKTEASAQDAESLRVAEALQGMGFRQADRFRQRDTYYDNEAGTIRRSGKALRIRETEDLTHGGVSATMNFKGPRMDRISMTRQELETELGQAETGRQILEALSFFPVPPEVIKERTEYRREEITACLDRVEGLGDFLELEILAEGAAASSGGTRAALEKLETILGILGYQMSDTVTHSYLSMLQRRMTL